MSPSNRTLTDSSRLSSCHTEKPRHHQLIILALFSASLIHRGSAASRACLRENNSYCTSCLGSTLHISGCKGILLHGRHSTRSKLAASYPFPHFNGNLLRFASSHMPNGASRAFCAGFYRILLRDNACNGVPPQRIVKARALAAEARRILPTNGGTYIARKAVVLWIPPEQKRTIQQLRRERRKCNEARARGENCYLSSTSLAGQPVPASRPPPGLLGLMQLVARSAACNPDSVTTRSGDSGVWETTTSC